MIVNPLAQNRVWDCLEQPDWWGRAIPMPADIAELNLVETELEATADAGIHGLRLRIHAHIVSEGRVVLPATDRVHPEGARLLKAYQSSSATSKKPKPKEYRSLAAAIRHVR